MGKFQYVLFEEFTGSYGEPLDHAKVIEQTPLTQPFLQAAEALCATDPTLDVRVSYVTPDNRWYTLFIMPQAEPVLPVRVETRMLAGG
jgi:hypothetical protein